MAWSRCTSAPEHLQQNKHPIQLCWPYRRPRSWPDCRTLRRPCVPRRRLCARPVHGSRLRAPNIGQAPLPSPPSQVVCPPGEYVCIDGEGTRSCAFAYYCLHNIWRFGAGAHLCTGSFPTNKALIQLCWPYRRPRIRPDCKTLRSPCARAGRVPARSTALD